MKQNQYRIDENILLRLNTNQSVIEPFKVFSENGNKQYISTLFDTTDETIDKTVWNFSDDYLHYLNKTFGSLRLYDVGDFQTESTHRIITGSLLLRQGFSWDNVFGILFVAKSMGNQFVKKVLISKIYDINDFAFNVDDSKELISGAFWTKHVDFCIPDLGEQIMVCAEIVTYDDIEAGNVNTGLVYNYPPNDSAYEPLIGEEPIPDHIVSNVSISPNCFLKIEPETLELNKTLEQSILDYFGLNSNVVSIDISHIIKYGTETSGYKFIRVSNEANKFGAINFGMDLTEFDSSVVTVFVATEIICNNKLMVRNNQLIFNYADVLNPVIDDLITAPETVYPVILNVTNTVTNTVIETKTEKQIVPIYQTIFAEIVTEIIVFENKNVTFEGLNKSAYLVVKTAEESFILSKITSDNKYYFNLGEVAKPAQNTEYNVIDADTRQIIHRGQLIVE